MHELFRNLKLPLIEDEEEKLLDDSGENFTAGESELGFLSGLFQRV